MPGRRRACLVSALALCLSIVALLGCSLPSLGARQPTAAPKVGVLCLVCPATFEGPAPPGPNVAAFREALRALGRVEGESISIIWRRADGQNERLGALAEDLVKQEVAVLVTMGGSPAAAAAHQATTTIPIVFSGVGDPVSSGYVASYARPGGNMTGLSNYSPETVAKRLEGLKEAVPGVARIAGLYSFANPSSAREWKDAQEAADRLGVILQPWDVRSFSDVEVAFQTLPGGLPDGLLVSGEPFLSTNRRRLLELVAARRIPAAYNLHEWVVDGGLISYGFNLTDQNRDAARYVDRILKGASPSELPVELPTTFDYAVNLTTAASMGLTIPASVLAQTTEVVK